MILLIIYIDSPLTQASIYSCYVSILYNKNMSAWVILLAEFIVLFITSRFLFKALFAFLYTLFRNQRVAIVSISVIFLPGVFVHEVAHLLVAELLQVRTHGIEFTPELSGTSLKMGSVQVEKSDIIRRLLIGIAPLIVGSAILIGALFLLSNTFSHESIFSSWISILITLIAILAIFIITNTMFSSKKDVEGLLEFLIIASILIGASYFAGFRPHEYLFALILQPNIVGVITRVDWLMGVPVGINIITVVLSIPLLRKLRFV